jgi:hypothetical protein
LPACLSLSALLCYTLGRSANQLVAYDGTIQPKSRGPSNFSFGTQYKARADDLQDEL